MASFSNVTLRSSIPKINAEAAAKAAAVVQVTAMNVQRDAATRSRVDTGRMRAGWQARPESAASWLILNGVNYSEFHEFGTRYISPQPMLVPAVEAAEQPFYDALRRIFQP